MNVILNEVYYGSNKLLEEAETHFEYIKRNVKKNPYKNAYIKNIKRFERLEEIFKELFNFESFRLMSSTLPDIVNAMVIPFIAFERMDKDNLKTTNGEYGVKFVKSKGKHMIMEITNGAIIELSPRGLVALMLHEIGHNFFSLKPNTFRHTLFPNSFNLLRENIKKYVANRTDSSRPEFESLEKQQISNNDEINQYYMDSMDSKVKIPLNMLFHTTMIAITIAVINVFYIGHLALKFKGFKDEKFADNFATSYGYGDAMAEVAFYFGTTMTTVGHTEKYNKLKKSNTPDSKVATMLAELNELNEAFIVLLVGEEHPLNYHRIKDQSDKLKYELTNNKNSLTPEMVKDIERQIENIDKVMDNYKDIQNNKFGKFFRKINIALGGDIRRLFTLSKKNYDKYLPTDK